MALYLSLQILFFSELVLTLQNDFLQTFNSAPSSREKQIYTMFPFSSQVEIYNSRGHFDALSDSDVSYLDGLGGEKHLFENFTIYCIPKDVFINENKENAAERKTSKRIKALLDIILLGTELRMKTKTKELENLFSKNLRPKKLMKILAELLKNQRDEEMLEKEENGENKKQNSTEKTLVEKEKLKNNKTKAWVEDENWDKDLFRYEVVSGTNKSDETVKEERHSLRVKDSKSNSKEDQERSEKYAERKDSLKFDAGFIKISKNRATAFKDNGIQESEELSKIYSRLQHSLGTRCFNTNDIEDLGNEGINAEVCPFKKIVRDQKYYIFEEGVEIQKDFKTTGFKFYLVTKYKLFGPSRSLNGGNEIGFIFECSPDSESKIFLDGHNFVLKTKLACVNQVYHVSSYSYSARDPESAEKLIYFYTISDSCDKATIHNKNFSYCFGKELKITETDSKEIVLGRHPSVTAGRYKMVRINTDNETTFLKLNMSPGELCKGGDDGLFQTKVVFICYEGLMFMRTLKILSVRETGPCSFLITIGVPKLCEHPFFNRREKFLTQACFYETLQQTKH